MDEVVVVLDAGGWARVSRLVDGEEVARWSGPDDQVDALALALEA